MLTKCISKYLQAAWLSSNEYQLTQANFPCCPVPDPCDAGLMDSDKSQSLEEFTDGSLRL